MPTSLTEIIESFTPEQRYEIEAHVARRVRAYKRVETLRRSFGFTQVQLAEALDSCQINVSRLECRRDHKLSTLSKYANSLGGRLEVRFRFPAADVADAEQIVELDLEP